MAEVKWTSQAAYDLETITNYIAADSPHYASLFAINVLKAADRLKPFPNSGRIVPETDDTLIREIILGNYRIVYRITENIVEILTVYHSSRLLDPEKLK